jgi:uncharacterized protein (TIGR03089 family)
VPTIWGLLQARARHTPGAPLVTYVDGAAGQRTELSGASLENAAAKIANALHDEYDLAAGATVAVRLPLHWQRSTWCAGVWTAGCVLGLAEAESADLIVTDVAGVGDVPSGTRAPIAVVSMHPFGLPTTEPIALPAHDATVVVRQQPDAYLFEVPVDEDAALELPDGTILTQGQLIDRALALAAEWSLASRGRLLAVESAPSVENWLACLAVPLVADASVILGRDIVDISGLTRTERVTATASRSA